MPTVLIAPASLRGKDGPFREILKAAGFDDFIDPIGEETMTEPELRASLPSCDAMVAGGEIVSAELLDLSPKLRAISRTGVGYDAIDMAACSARKIAVTITPGTNQESVAEHTLGLLLALTRNLVNNDVSIKAGGWNRALVAPVRGKTLGLIGMGRIGRAVTTRAIAFGMRVVAFDPLSDAEFDARHGITRLSLADLLAESDVVSLHLPLGPETRGLINRATLSQMRPGSILINTARGGLVVEADLHEALTSGHLAGAGLDVLNREPPEAGNLLLTLPNVVLSPHLGGIDTKSMADMADMAAGCIAALKRGQWPAGCVVNDQLRDGWTW
jgi:D-3-phosphoglycerate dehydrogenase / 2-oxoglutarate reductase